MEGREAENDPVDRFADSHDLERGDGRGGQRQVPACRPAEDAFPSPVEGDLRAEEGSRQGAAAQKTPGRLLLQVDVDDEDDRSPG